MFKYVKVILMSMIVSFNIVVYAADVDCHPPINPNKAQYFIGYGSLMQEASKRKDGDNTGFNLPVYVKGFQREWSARGPNVGITLASTFLGVSVNEKATMAAALFRVFKIEDVDAFDKREFFYCRHAVNPKQITMADGTPVPEGEFWIYVTLSQYIAPPNANYPISQVYADLFLEGCVELEDKFDVQGFLQNCIKTTAFWSKHWVNDRVHPRVVPITQPNTLRIDQTLQQVIPQEFQARYIE